jgi:biotin carboxylase
VTTPHLVVLPPSRLFKATAMAVVEAAGRCGVTLTVGSRLPPSDFAHYRHVEQVLQLPDLTPPAGLEELRGAVGALAAAKRLRRVVTFHEAYVEFAADLNAVHDLGGVSPETARRCRDKYLMRKALARHGVPVPAFRRVADAPACGEAACDLGFPVIVKPSNGSASRGVSKVLGPDDVAVAFREARAVPEGIAVLVEEYIGGPEFSIELVVSAGRVHVAGCTAKTTEPEPYFCEIMHIFPAELTEAETTALCELAEATVTALGIEEGGVHLEARLGKRGPVVMECAARLGGDSIPLAVQLASGIDLYEAALLAALGRPVELQQKRRRTAGVRFMQAASAGVVEALRFDQERLRRIPGLVTYGLLRKPGESVARPPQGPTNRLAFAIAVGSSARLVEATLVQAEEALAAQIREN